MSMYVRVKRPEQTVFIYADHTEAVQELKAKLSSISSVAAENIRLVSADGASLDDDKTLADCKVDNDQVLFQVHRSQDGSWEDVEALISGCKNASTAS
eukprot:CAMPEP_0114613678 /NCGR_PEP_ID=MMETSP0168-20121206/5257_1 /TAXON_ID=95228 ORGANISM="Vannella sp., Strain DIVA3 517/6/12" /NCGR_SAMPLE_ID=MMETSP0168 /ASSEMBLY_ACC=CAM_ASM_000044 /LENGTH=97 /DNA_ID=CAMNT_0001824693 /DNA_START=44 /DNA_END=337 /DNA_ORIENTATION=-